MVRKNQETAFLPSRKDVEAVLRNINGPDYWREGYSSPRILSLKEAADKAKEALQEFRATDPTYLALEAAKEKTSREYDKARRREDKYFNKRKNELMSRLRLRGVTEELVRDVEKFRADYPEKL